MSRRISVILPDATLAVLDMVAPRGYRSAVISEAIHRYVKARRKHSLRERLKEEALRNANRDLEMAAEWFALEEEAWWREEATQGPET